MKDIDALLRKLGPPVGYTLTRGKRTGHWKVYDSAGRMVTSMSSTPSDYRSLRNFKGQLRRAGVPI